MTRFLRQLSQWLWLLPIGVFLYDLVYEWVVLARFKMLTLGEWIDKLSGVSSAESQAALSKVVPASFAEVVINNMACLVLIAPPLFFYILYRIFRASSRNGMYRYD